MKQSDSEKIEIRPVVNSPSNPVVTSSHSPFIHVLTSPHLTLQSSLRGVCQLGEKKKQGVSIADAPIHFEFAPAREHQSLSGTKDYSQDDARSYLLQARDFQQTPECSTGSERPADSDAESGHQQRSTLEDALAAPTCGFSTFTFEVLTSSVDNGDVTATNQPARLSISSRELIRKCFRATTSIRLPQGLSVIALNQEQVNCI